MRYIIKFILLFLWLFIDQKIMGNEEKKIIIIIPSYNNKQWYQQNLDSVIMQEYSNYFVIYIDDCSTDGTTQLVEKYINEKKLNSKIKLIKNKKRQGALANIYYAVHSCDDHCIIMTLDGDDWWCENHVLAAINKVYTNPNVWLTYGNYKFFPETSHHTCMCKKIPYEIIQKNSYRDAEWMVSQQRTFYAWLFKKINREDLLYNNDFFLIAHDVAIMFPMLEMSGGRFKFIDEKFYVYNVANPINDFKKNRKLQSKIDTLIRKKTKYTSLLKDIYVPPN